MTRDLRERDAGKYAARLSIMIHEQVTCYAKRNAGSSCEYDKECLSGSCKGELLLQRSRSCRGLPCVHIRKRHLLHAAASRRERLQLGLRLLRK